MKYLITFEKGDSARWLGHLDILRTFERAIRRADLPIAFTTGFNPRERIAFANALSVGVTGAEEPATLELTTSLPPEDIVQRLNTKLPPGIQLKSAEEIPDAGSRDLLNSYDRAELSVICDGPLETNLQPTRETLQAAANALLSESELIVEREREGKTKRVNIRPLIHSIIAEEAEGGRVRFTMILALGSEGTAKPAEIVGLLARQLPNLALRRVHRVRLLQCAGEPTAQERAAEETSA